MALRSALSRRNSRASARSRYVPWRVCASQRQARPTFTASRARPAAAHALALFEVERGKDLDEPALSEQAARGAALVVAVFEQQPAARPQVRRRRCDNRADGIEAVGAGRECGERLETQVAPLQVRVCLSDVRWIRYE